MTNLLIDKYTYGAPTVMDWGEGCVCRIGRFCSIAGAVTVLLGGEHDARLFTTYPFGFTNTNVFKSYKVPGIPATKGDVTIGNDVWLTYGVTILSGVTVGDGAVVGAHSVVTKDVAPYSLVAGNPAQLIRKRFDDETIWLLLRLKWWDWPDAEINQHLALLCSSDVVALRHLAEQRNV